MESLSGNKDGRQGVCRDSRRDGEVRKQRREVLWESGEEKSANKEGVRAMAALAREEMLEGRTQGSIRIMAGVEMESSHGHWLRPG